jgi:hypothetical protein
MTKKQRGDLLKAMREGAYGGRSDVYRWLRKNFEAVSQGMAEHRPSWDVVAAQMARDGVMGARGKPPYGHSVRRVWQRVRRDVEKDKATRAATPKQRAFSASRVPTTWRPTPVNERRGEGAQRVDGIASNNSADDNGGPAPPRTAEEKLAAFWRTLKGRSSR